MEAVINFVKNIADVIVAVFDFLIGLIEDLVFMVGLLGQFVVNIPSYLAWLPGSVISIIVVIFSIVVIYKILGREG